MKIAIGCDHAGFTYKEAIKEFLEKRGVDVIDKGANSADSVDYPDFVHPVARALVAKKVNFGIVICGSGNGVAMTINKYADIRCGLCWNRELAVLTRQHNNANALAIPARFIDLDTALEVVEGFLQSKFEGGRHKRRVDKIAPEIDFMC